MLAHADWLDRQARSMARDPLHPDIAEFIEGVEKKDYWVAEWARGLASAEKAHQVAEHLRFLVQTGDIKEAKRYRRQYEVERLHLGQLALQAAIRTGRKQRQSLKDARDTANARKRLSAGHLHAEWQAIADEIWARKPGLSASAVGLIIEDRLAKAGTSAKAGTIRRAIKKPVTTR